MDLRSFESSDVYVDRSGNNLIIAFSPTSGVTVTDHFTSPGLIEQIVFADGTFSGSSDGGSVGTSSTIGGDTSAADTIEDLLSTSEEQTDSEGAKLRKTVEKLKEKFAEHNAKEGETNSSQEE